MIKNDVFKLRKDIISDYNSYVSSFFEIEDTRIKNVVDEAFSSGLLWPGSLIQRIVELTYTAWDLGPFAKDCGFDGPPFRWDEEKRFLLCCELDAAFFHLYLHLTLMVLGKAQMKANLKS